MRYFIAILFIIFISPNPLFTYYTLPAISENDSYIPIGINIGISEKKFFLGAEISLVNFYSNSGFWMGIYTDTSYIFIDKEIRLSIGPEFGLAFIGIDGGLIFSSKNSGTGITARVLLSLIYFHVYVRVIKYYDSKDFLEYGFITKYPFDF